MFCGVGPIREKSHRLAPEAYRGSAVGAFTVNVRNGTEPLLNPGIFQIAQLSLNEAFQQHGGHCGVFVFMPDHLHVIASGRGPESDLLAMVAAFKQKATFQARKAGYSFAWQKDFYDHLIRASEDYGAQVRYLLRNPVRRGLCERWQDWPYKGVLGQTWEQLAATIVSF